MKNRRGEKQPKEQRSGKENALAQTTCQFCDGHLAAIDAHRAQFSSRTVKCETCGECYLHVSRGGRSAEIHLCDFLSRRGDAPERRTLDDRAMAEGVIRAMVSDEWPSAAACTDFGLDTPEHYAAMQRAVSQGLTSYELDRVLGDGRAITTLVDFASRDKRLAAVQFSTPYDELYGAMEPDVNHEARQHEHGHLSRKLNTKSSLDR